MVLSFVAAMPVEVSVKHHISTIGGNVLVPLQKEAS